jgi:uncharacterized protein
MSLTFLNVPGFTGSGPHHWQTLWEQHYDNFHRVQQKDWEQPYCSQWVGELDNCITQISNPIILVGHSLGCITIINWLSKSFQNNVKAAFLVAPSDPQNPNFPIQAIGFDNLSMESLPINSILVSSCNDPFLSTERATILAKSWECQLKNMGMCGHMNTDSNLGIWAEGKKLLDELTETVKNNGATSSLTTDGVPSLGLLNASNRCPLFNW